MSATILGQDGATSSGSQVKLDGVILEDKGVPYNGGEGQGVGRSFS